MSTNVVQEGRKSGHLKDRHVILLDRRYSSIYIVSETKYKIVPITDLIMRNFDELVVIDRLKFFGVLDKETA